jgi:hypothetical protein
MRIKHTGLIFTAPLLLIAASAGTILQAQDTRGGMESMSTSPDRKMKVMAATALPLKLGSGPTTVKMAPASAAEEASLSLALKSLKPEEHLYVVLRDLKASEPPGVLYDVYLDLPQGVHPKLDDPHIIGTINFYNSVGASAGNPEFLFSFDVTDAARWLQSRNLLSNRTTVTIVPSGIPEANAEAVLGRIELVKQ